MGGPQSAQLHGSGRARLGPMAAYGFQLDICTDANLTEKCHSVRQRGYPLSPEDGTAPGTGVDATALTLLLSMVPDTTPTVSSASAVPPPRM